MSHDSRPSHQRRIIGWYAPNRENVPGVRERVVATETEHEPAPIRHDTERGQIGADSSWVGSSLGGREQFWPSSLQVTTSGALQTAQLHLRPLPGLP